MAPRMGAILCCVKCLFLVRLFVGTQPVDQIEQGMAICHVQILRAVLQAFDELLFLRAQPGARNHVFDS